MYGIFSILEYGKISLRVRATFQPMYLYVWHFSHTQVWKNFIACTGYLPNKVWDFSHTKVWKIFHCMYGLITSNIRVWKISYYFFYSVSLDPSQCGRRIRRIWPRLPEIAAYDNEFRAF